MTQAIATMRKQTLHISHSQLFTYLNCGLKFWFQYVQGMPREHSSINLHFGKAMHTGIETFYLALKESGKKPPLELMEAAFSSKLYQSLELESAPLLFKKDMPDTASAVALGKRMLEVFHQEAEIDGFRVEAVELPLAANLYNHRGELMDIQLVGVLDLLIRDRQGNLIAVDHKTSRQAKSQADVDGDLQLTAYSYLLAANKRVFPKAEVRCQFNVIRKLKTPKLETYQTTRGPVARKRFAKLCATVLSGIDNQVYLPCRSWLCADCEYAGACKEW